MSLNLNKIIISGRLCADPELKQTQTGVSIVNIRIAVTRRFGSGGKDPETDFFSATAWRSTAEFINKYFRKGSSICMVGSIQNRSWTDRQGQKSTVTEIMADEVYFVESKSQDAISTTPRTAAANDVQPAYQAPALNAPNFDAVVGDGDLPF